MSDHLQSEKEKERIKNSSKVHYKFKTKGKEKTNLKWPFLILFITLAISFTINIVASIFTERLSLYGAYIVLIVIVLIGILFDILGTAVISANMISFSSMASDKVRGSKEAIAIIKKASIYSNLFNDVIGDTCATISGATLGAIFAKMLMSTTSIYYTLFSAIIAAATVGGKAFGKGFAIKNSELIVYHIGRFVSFFNPSYYIKHNNQKNK